MYAWSQPRCPKTLAMAGFLGENLPRSKEKATDQRVLPPHHQGGSVWRCCHLGRHSACWGVFCAPLVSGIPGFYPPRPAVPPAPPSCRDDQNCLQTLPNVPSDKIALGCEALLGNFLIPMRFSFLTYKMENIIGPMLQQTCAIK